MIITAWETSNYGVILGQDSMQALDLDNSVWDNTLSLGEKEVPMVPPDYWSEERSQQHRAHLSVQSLPIIKAHNEPIKDRTEDLNITEALQAVCY